ncbi:MAG: hypothetical protein A3C93_01065 [Candidatus Lloydbacteria bacterium RIFCSPHIGHO2_02_FULL_54_17]|uniref:Lipoprotein n=1 Tax=Candidatus Lloydbacteria bacterium RIFCSPHIGHO2_02_FULL_54_17 TaxID=1798664 RepID=A0A1G2DF41_9BACT|nr:MAG: hypothetical protein A2762_06375 [Candidatus Lloydbacteria bacterium RIFCSPHIGHO2_01_FULL_54_11]OGZ11490.1 MAG: hypothetical protein A3C93_01065 [Candidatus Lloydbacteria bacterium RIFCSPHIGHO2_02_FULL_54_17]OGZ14388.1 MAG: hypothetical protein A2948_00420 [Candidatus Lloydbacteria bacterium RIFCSPLOWO2_01_FULL_54_18]OGZ16816.1 MAG: hypothetical protein A3H76_02170 [Candidatus Lloydbacteria bacterium RIFCSPLOWO2_02_FULL_54_12]
MKNVLNALLVLVLAGFFGGCTQSTQSASENTLAAFEGTYVGFSPTDESAVRMGEMEITIKGQEISMRMATGHRIQEEKMSTVEFVPMTAQEVKELFREGSKYPERTTGFKGTTGLPKFLFFRDPAENETGLIVKLGEMSEILGPTMLFSPAQVKRGDYEKALQNIEKQAGKGVLPRLRNGGKAEKK